MLAGRGLRVVRFDNRDAGRSSRIEGHSPSLRQLVERDRSAVVYSLADMAHDAVGLFDHLGVDRGHVVGASMGGMIAQTIAFNHPDRVASLVSIGASDGGPVNGQPTPDAFGKMLSDEPVALYGRQLAAVMADGDRTERLKRIACTTTVIHGTADKLIHISGGRAVARAIPGAQLVEIEGRGHFLPPEVWPPIVDEIVATAQRASCSRRRDAGPGHAS